MFYLYQTKKLEDYSDRSLLKDSYRNRINSIKY